MIQKDLKELIDKYCMGIQPTDAQMDEIFDKIQELGADPNEVNNYINEMMSGPTRAEREAQAKAEREAKEKAQREAKAKAEREARERAEREEKERKERAKAEAERKARLEETRIKAEAEARKAEAEAAVRKAEAEARKAEAEAEKAKRRAEAEAEEEKRKKKQKMIWGTVAGVAIPLIILCFIFFSYIAWYITTAASAVAALMCYLKSDKKSIKWGAAAVLAYFAVYCFNNGKEAYFEHQYDSMIDSSEDSYESVQTEEIDAEVTDAEEVSMDDVDEDDITEDAAIVNEDGLTIQDKLKLRYDYVYSESDGMYKVEKNDKKGFCDAKTGREIVKPIYDYIYSWESNGLAKVEIGEKKGFINKQGKTIVPCKYTYIYSESNGLIKVEINDKKGFLNAKTFKEVTPCIYDYIYNPSGGLIKVEQGSKVGYLKLDGSLAKKPE